MTPGQIKDKVEKIRQENQIKINEVKEKVGPPWENENVNAEETVEETWCRSKRTERRNLKKNTLDQIH